MPTKLPHTTELPTSPAMVFFLLTGTPATQRIKGWVRFEQAGLFDIPTPDQVWAAHRDELVALAAAAGFEPYRAALRTPRGPRFDAWRTAFLKEHGY
jgi:hypothetical protein